MIDRQLNYGRHIIRAYVQASGLQGRALDIAAGSGSDLGIVRQTWPRSELNALECYSPNIGKLESRGIKVFDRNIEKDIFPFEDESMDLVIANQILEHTKEIFWIFNEISRVLRIGGRMIIGVPNLASLHNRILLLLGRQPSPIKSASAHVRGFTRSDLMSFMECWPGGYRLIDFQGSNFYPFPSLIARPLARCLPTMAWGIFLLVEKTRAYDGAFVRFPVDQKLETNFYLGKTLQL